MRLCKIILKPLIAFALIATSCTSDDIVEQKVTDSPDLDQKSLIVLNELSDSLSSRLINAVAENLIESTLRYPVLVNKESNSDSQRLSDVQENEVDAVLDLALSQLSGDDEEINLEDDSSFLGTNGVSAGRGWYVPSYSLERYDVLANSEAFKDPEISFQFSDNSTTPNGKLTVQSESEFDQEIIDSNNLPIIIDEIPNRSSFVEFIDANIEEEEHFLVKLESPSALIDAYSLELVETPTIENCKSVEVQKTNCKYVAENLIKVISPELESKAQLVKSFIQAFELTNEDIMFMTREVEIENKSVAQSAQSWINQNKETWNTWL